MEHYILFDLHRFVQVHKRTEAIQFDQEAEIQVGLSAYEDVGDDRTASPVVDGTSVTLGLNGRENGSALTRLPRHIVPG